MPRFQRLRVSGRRDQQVSTSLGRHRVAFPRARSVDFGAESVPLSESTTPYSELDKERSFYQREVTDTKLLQRQSSMDSETASASQRSTCSPSSLYSITSPCLDLQSRSSRQNPAGASARTISRRNTDSTTGRQLREAERSEEEEEGGPSYYLNGVEEEAWASLWDTYRRLFPGSLEGCSPPPEEYFLHSRGSARGRQPSPLARRSGVEIDLSPAWAGVASEGALVGAGTRERISGAGRQGVAVAVGSRESKGTGGGKGGIPVSPGVARSLKPVAQLSTPDAESLRSGTVTSDQVGSGESHREDHADEEGAGEAAVGGGDDVPDGDNGPGGWLQFDMEM